MNKIENSINITNKKEHMSEFVKNCGFNSYEHFKEKIKQALEASENGGYKIKSIHFIKYIFGNIEPTDFSEYRKEINIAINKIKKENEEKKQQLIDEAKEDQKKEEKRTDTHPEDLNNQ